MNSGAIALQPTIARRGNALPASPLHLVYGSSPGVAVALPRGQQRSHRQAGLAVVLERVS
jgi:hypothetical protein